MVIASPVALDRLLLLLLILWIFQSTLLAFGFSSPLVSFGRSSSFFFLMSKLYPALESKTHLYAQEVGSKELRAMAADKETWPNSAHENDRLTKYGGGEGTTGNAYRDLLGYGPNPSVVKWPKGAKVALNFVINYEEGGERCVLHGDKESESLLSDIPGAQPIEGKRNVNMESMYDYGSRSGFWRLHRLFTSRKAPVTVFAVGMALERNPAVCHALREQKDWEVASHGYRWIDYQNVDEDTEREHIQRSVLIHERLLGKRPIGIYQGKPNENTRRLVVEEGGFKYDSDSYGDDLPYWNMDFPGKMHLVIPYTLTENDMRFTTPNGYSNGEAFARDLKETLRYLVDEGRAGHPKMMSVGLHCRLARPGRVAAIAEFLDFARSYGRDVWICTREEIADFWTENHYPKGAGSPMKSPLADDGEGSGGLGELLVGFPQPELGGGGGKNGGGDDKKKSEEFKPETATAAETAPPEEPAKKEDEGDII